MGVKEDKVKNAILKRFGGVWRLWTNPVGCSVFYDSDTGRSYPVDYGLCVGSSDLIGIRPIRITEEHVGKVIGQFVAIETKAPGMKSKATEAQKTFLALIERFGGLAALADNPEDVLKKMEEFNAQCITRDGSEAPRPVRSRRRSQKNAASTPDLCGE